MATPAEPAGKGSLVAFPVSASDDATLVAGLIQSKPAAVAELFDRFGGLIRRMLTRTLGSTRDIDDLAQETFLTIIRRAPTLRDPSTFRSFVVSIAIRTAKNELRKRTVRDWIGLGEMSTPPIAPAHDAAAAQAVQRVYKALDQLDAGSRLAFVLRHIEEYDLAEAAEACGCSLATLKRRLARAEKR